MADRKLAYGSSSALTITLDSLASSATFTAGRQSTVVSNTTNNYLDYLIGGKITTGTTPTTARTIRVYVFGQIEDTPTYVDQLTGTDAARSFTSADILNATLRLAAVLGTDATSNRTYWIPATSVLNLFGGIVMPKSFGVYVAHDTAVALNATSTNHAIWVTGIYETIV